MRDILGLQWLDAGSREQFKRNEFVLKKLNSHFKLHKRKTKCLHHPFTITQILPESDQGFNLTLPEEFTTTTPEPIDFTDDSSVIHFRFLKEKKENT